MKGHELSYWSAMAQVLPVLGVGLILEIRAISNRPVFKESKFYRRINSAAWAFAASSLALGLIVSLMALQAGSPPSEFGSFVADFAFAYSASAVLLIPVIDLILTGNSDVTGRVFAASPKRWILARRVQRLSGSLRKEVAVARRLLFENLVLAEEVLRLLQINLSRARGLEEEAERLLDPEALEKLPDDATKAREALAELVEERRQVEADIAAATDKISGYESRWRNKIREENNIAKWQAYARRRLKEAASEEIAKNAQFFSQIHRARMGEAGYAKPVFLSPQGPDDGGFLSDVPVRGLVLWVRADYFVLDPMDFERFEAIE